MPNKLVKTFTKYTDVMRALNKLIMTVDNLEIPPNATIRQEYVKCGDPDCENSHGPYLYAYWKHDKKLIKIKLIQHEASKGNALAKQYLEKLRKEQVSIDWAHRVLINSIRQQRMLKMMAIADDRHFSYDNETELVRFIDLEMQKEGLDLNIEENLDSYLNTKFM